MAIPIYTQTVIAFIWDFDKTLIPGYQQEALFEAYGVDGPTFWAEVNGLVEHYAKRDIRVAKDTAYLGHMLTYVQGGKWADLSNQRLRDLGARIPTFPGIPEFFDLTANLIAENDQFAKHDIAVEHYVVSTGLRAMIEGSVIGGKVKDIWANDFIDEPLPPGYLGQLPSVPAASPISQVGYMLDNTTKTRAVFEINKGINVNGQLDVNSLMAPEDRRVPFKNMIYIADGPSDVPVFSVLNQNAGKTFAVYTADNGRGNFREVKSLLDQGRVQGMAEADYREGSAAYLWLTTTMEDIATEIATTREQYLSHLPAAPGHVV